MSTHELPAVDPPAPYRSLVVGTDFSPCSAVAVAAALRIAAGSDATLRAVHVIDTRVVVDFESALSDFQRTVREHLTDAAKAMWKGFAASVPGAAGIPIEFELNNRIAGVLGLVHEARADLLVLGAFGDRRPDVGFGTLATACVRKAGADVLLVRDTQQGPFRTVVVGVDFSETSLRALHRAARFAASEGAELHALHVLDAPWRHLPYLAPESMTPFAMEKAYREAIERQLAEFIRPVTAANPGLKLRAVCDDPGTHRVGIAGYASRVGADLVALGTRGRTNLRDVLLGSTAERVLAESRCSVLAIKPAGFRHPLADGG
jgi:nucleotide-binding universal stress UspA family protein